MFGKWIKKRKSVLLEVEMLEERTVPVLGATTAAAVVPAGGEFDGVAFVQGLQHGNGTASLLTTERHLLTAAHVLSDRPVVGLPAFPVIVKFDLIRTDPIYNVPIDVQVPIFVNPPTPTAPINFPQQFQYIHPGFDRDNIAAGNDIAVILLHDQEPGLQHGDRHLVAPFGAQRYHRYVVPNPPPAPPIPANELTQQITLIGYGEDGRGNDGNHNDEIQRVTITGIDDVPESGATFTLSLTPPGGGNTIEAVIQVVGMSSQNVAQAFVSAGASSGNITVMAVSGPANTNIWFFRVLCG